MGHNVVSAYASIQHHLKRTSLVARVAAILASGPGPVARASTNSSTRSVRGFLPKIPCAMLKALPPAISQDHRRIACGQEILQALFCPDAIRQLGYASYPPTINSDLQQCEAVSRNGDGDRLPLHRRGLSTISVLIIYSAEHAMSPCMSQTKLAWEVCGRSNFSPDLVSTKVTHKTLQQLWIQDFRSISDPNTCIVQG